MACDLRDKPVEVYMMVLLEHCAGGKQIRQNILAFHRVCGEVERRNAGPNSFNKGFGA